MSFEQEWAAHKNEAAMRLNGTGGGQGGGDADLKTNNTGKAAAVSALTNQIQPGAGKAGVVADESTNSAVTGFKGWATGAGLKDALEEWSLQVKSLQGRLANDRSSLQEAKKSYLLNDVHTGNDLLRLGGPQSQGPYAPSLQSPPLYGPYAPDVQ
ncbi:hypothetical protein AB0L68_27575 [Streptomyces sp. NPDC052164]|uniref:hypothetical protein n=1 Tax=unclassified Streptomyces TaxID=2593676 RepID=UPI00342263C2